MKKLQLPKNKFIRLAINIIFVPIWYFLSEKLLFPIVDFLFFLPNGSTVIYENDFFKRIYFLTLILAFLMPIILLIRYIWFGRIKPRPKITRSKD